MEKQIYEVGNRVEKLCDVCKEERGHIVASVSKLGRITRVLCPKCNTRSSFKSGNQIAEKHLFNLPGEPYDQMRTYHLGQLMMHSTYGLGEVVKVIEPRKIDVLFSDKLRRLVHAQPLAF
jgi:hypothetical protein